ncbi:ATP-binding protein [Leptospira sp. 201903070]|uniref:ATP-binding protein n=2 Tax=Leptospira ainlahdjerensis TaxID=2810033 RepID=A0ABS2UET7_9LEPT|nr:ATP-binding protein [Leptospira ainlahdjerensis]
MLLQFTVNNFSSFKDDVVLSMIPAKSRSMKEHIIKDVVGKSTEALPLIVIYGANASGKTNLVRAFRFLRKIILQGTPADQNIQITPHKLDPITEKGATKFEIIFKHNNVVYTYGFLLNSKIILEEWLFGYYTSQESKIFERITKEDDAIVEPGQRLISDVESADFIKYVAKGTRPNQLFLTEGNDKNIKLFKPVIEWMREKLIIIGPDSQYRSLAFRAFKDKKFIEYLSKFLQVADTGINKIQCEAEVFDPDKHLSGYPAQFKLKIMEDVNSKSSQYISIGTPDTKAAISKNEKDSSLTFLRLKTEHTRTDGKAVLFDIKEESDGTQRLMDLAPMFVDMGDESRVVIIDELDRSLHTHLSRLFIQSCLERVSEKKATDQFIVTSHDTNLLDRSLLRRDEILFMEKDKAGASHLSSLSEYNVSEGLNFENGYLNGRFGAVPIIKNTF